MGGPREAPRLLHAQDLHAPEHLFFFSAACCSDSSCVLKVSTQVKPAFGKRVFRDGIVSFAFSLHSTWWSFKAIFVGVAHSGSGQVIPALGPVSPHSSLVGGCLSFLCRLEGHVRVPLCLAARWFSRACVLASPDPCRLRGRALPVFFLDLHGNLVQLVIADVHNAQADFASAAMTGLCCAILESTSIDSLLIFFWLGRLVASDRHT